MFCPQYTYSTVSPTAACVTLGVTLKRERDVRRGFRPQAGGRRDVVALLDHDAATGVDRHGARHLLIGCRTFDDACRGCLAQRGDRVRFERHILGVSGDRDRCFAVVRHLPRHRRFTGRRITLGVRRIHDRRRSWLRRCDRCRRRCRWSSARVVGDRRRRQRSVGATVVGATVGCTGLGGATVGCTGLGGASSGWAPASSAAAQHWTTSWRRRLRTPTR